MRTINEADYKEEEEDAEPEPLRMEHFYFRLGMWLVGLILSVIHDKAGGAWCHQVYSRVGGH